MRVSSIEVEAVDEPLSKRRTDKGIPCQFGFGWGLFYIFNKLEE